MRPKLKGLFFGVPNINTTKTLTPVADRIAAGDYTLIYYNYRSFQPAGHHSFQFREYPAYEGGYHTEGIEADTSFFRFGEMLIDTATHLVNFLQEEVEREKPDFILYSHLAVWGKLISLKYKLPAVALYSVAVLHPEIMMPYMRQVKDGRAEGLDHVYHGIRFYNKSKSLLQRLHLAQKPDIWDVYINKGMLNVVFIMKELQPRPELLNGDFSFVGYPMDVVPVKKRARRLVYVSPGTVFNKDVRFHKICISVIGKTAYACVMAAGRHVTMEELGELPENIQVVPFTDQVDVLKKASLFITRGGMSSIQEAIGTLTPMIIVPIIPEQRMNASQVEALGIGIHIPSTQLTSQSLQKAIEDISGRYSWYVQNLQKLAGPASAMPAENKAFHLIDNFLHETASCPGNP